MTTGTDILASTPEPLRRKALRPGGYCHGKHDPLTALVRHLARQAARQMFRDGGYLDGGEIEPPNLQLGD